MLVGFGALAVVFTLFYRFGVRIPLRPFFAVTSVLLYYMAFVFMGKGIRELQEGNLMPITVIPGFPHVEALGLFPSVETLLGQALLLVLFVFALVKTFWPHRAVDAADDRAGGVGGGVRSADRAAGAAREGARGEARANGSRAGASADRQRLVECAGQTLNEAESRALGVISVR